jgi:PiT family inorganic phosphate transporter
LLGAIAIAVGIFTYSKKVMLTVGQDLLPLSPVAAWVVVISHSIVLFLFASEGLEYLLANNGLPTIPLVPVSSSQAVIGAVVGIGLMRGGREIRWQVLANIGGGWITTPVISAVVCFIALFFLQNVFNQQVYREVRYELSAPVLKKLSEHKIPIKALQELRGKSFNSGVQFLDALHAKRVLTDDEDRAALYYAQTGKFVVESEKIDLLDESWFTAAQMEAIRNLSARTFGYRWTLAEALANKTSEWRLKDNSKVNKLYNKDINRKLDYVYRTFSVNE